MQRKSSQETLRQRERKSKKKGIWRELYGACSLMYVHVCEFWIGTLFVQRMDSVKKTGKLDGEKYKLSAKDKLKGFIHEAIWRMDECKSYNNVCIQ